MVHKNIFFLVIACSASIYTQSVKAQNRITSPYSRYGIGDMYSVSSPQILGVGGLTNAYRSNTVVNFENPASFTAFDSLSCVFEASILSNINQLSTTEKNLNYRYSSLNSIVFGFPITKWWKSSFGLTPLSKTGYSFLINSKDTDTGLDSSLVEGYGGINRVYFGNGLRVKNFSVGFNVSYLFGQFYNSQNYFTANTYDIKTNNSLYVNDFLFNGGAQYQFSFKTRNLVGVNDSTRCSVKASNAWKKLTNNMVIVFGVSGNNSREINTTEAFSVTRTNSLNDSTDMPLNIEKSYSAINLPRTIGAGIIIKKDTKWLLGFDYNYTQWSDYYNFSYYTQIGNLNKYITDSWTAATGFEYCFGKTKLRMGYKYSFTNLKFNFKQIEQKSVSVGLGIPFKGSKNMVNISLEAGERGTTKFGLIRERYIRAIFALSIYERWFVKPKYY